MIRDQLNAKNAQILAIQSLRVWHIFNRIDFKEQCELTNYIHCFLFVFLVHALIKQASLSIRPVRSIQKDINNTRQFTKFFRSRQEMERLLSYVRVVDYHPTQWLYNNRHSNGKHYSCLVDSTNDDLFQHVTLFSTLALELQKQLDEEKSTTISDYGLSRVPKPPYSYGPVVQFLVTYCPFHCTAEIDIPSKVRTNEFITMVIYLFVFLFGDWFDNALSIPSPWLNQLSESCKHHNETIGFTLIVGLLALREAALLNDQHVRLALRGIQRRVAPYHDFPPTCLGRQVTAQHLFVGQNTILHTHIYYLIEISEFIKRLEHLQRETSSLSGITILPACIEARNNLKLILKWHDDYEPDTAFVDIFFKKIGLMTRVN